MMCPWTREMAILLAESITCARERNFFSAGMWLNDARRARDSIPDPDRKRLGTKLLEAVCEAIDEAQRRQTEKVIAAALYRMRRPRTERPTVSMGLSATK